MSRTRVLTLLLACLALAVFAAGCGGDDNDDSGSSAPAPATTTETGAAGTETGETTTEDSGSSEAGGEIEIKMQNIAFSPKAVTAKVGQTIKWSNEDSVEHDVKATAGEEFKSDLFGKGGEFSYKLDKAGEIKYVCTVHPGMEGTITVQ